MNLQEIKAAVLAGKTVHWSNSSYRVVHTKGVFYIVCEGGSTIGLTHLDNTTLNGKEEEFYKQQTAVVLTNCGETYYLVVDGDYSNLNGMCFATEDIYNDDGLNGFKSLEIALVDQLIMIASGVDPLNFDENFAYILHTPDNSDNSYAKSCVYTHAEFFEYVRNNSCIPVITCTIGLT